MKIFGQFLLSVALLAFFAGCSSLPRVPEWRPPAAVAPTFPTAEVRAQIGQIAPNASIYLSDTTFVALNHEWLEEELPWSWHFAKAIGFAYTGESGDCEKFSLLLALGANVAAMRAGVRAQPLLARIDVWQFFEFGGVPATGGSGHSLNGVFTDRPPHFWVVEPQSRTLVPLRDYPNRGFIFAVRIGG